MNEKNEKDERGEIEVSLSDHPSLPEVLKDRLDFMEMDESLFGWLLSLNKDMYEEIYDFAMAGLKIQSFFDSVESKNKTEKDIVDGINETLDEEESKSIENFSLWTLLEVMKGDFDSTFTVKEYDTTASDILAKLGIIELYKKIGVSYIPSDNDDDWEWNLDMNNIDTADDIPFLKTEILLSSINTNKMKGDD